MNKRSNRDVITAFILQNQDRLYRFAYSYVRDREDALDIVQDSICKALSSEKSLSSSTAVKTWCYRIVANCAIDFLRTRRNSLYLEADKVETGCDKYLDFDLQTAIASLSTRNKTIVILRFYEDMKIEEIARIVGENPNTVKTALYSSLRKLRVQLDDPENRQLFGPEEAVPLGRVGAIET